MGPGRSRLCVSQVRKKGGSGPSQLTTSLYDGKNGGPERPQPRAATCGHHTQILAVHAPGWLPCRHVEETCLPGLCSPPGARACLPGPTPASWGPCSPGPCSPGLHLPLGAHVRPREAAAPHELMAEIPQGSRPPRFILEGAVPLLGPPLLAPAAAPVPPGTPTQHPLTRGQEPGPPSLETLAEWKASRPVCDSGEA